MLDKEIKAYVVTDQWFFNTSEDKKLVPNEDFSKYLNNQITAIAVQQSEKLVAVATGLNGEPCV